MKGLQLKKDVKNCFSLYIKYVKETLGIKFIIIGIFLSIINQLCSLAIPFISKFVIDIAIIQRNTQILLITFLVSLGILAIMALTSLVANFLLFKVFANSGIQLKLDLFKNIQMAPLNFFNQVTRGDITYRILTDTEKLVGFWTQCSVMIPFQLILLLASITMITWNKNLAIFVFIILAIQSLVIVLFNKPLLKYSFLIKEKAQEVHKYTVEHFSRIELVRSFSNEKPERDGFLGLLNEKLTIDLKSFLIHKYSENVNLIISNLWIVLVLWYGGSLVINNEISIGTLLAFLMLANILYKPIYTLTELFLAFPDVRSSLSRINEYDQVKPQVIEPANALDFVPQEGNISIENCSFTYDDHKILKNVSLNIPSKSIFALAGPSGSGKTTLCRLIVRFFDPQEGNIYMDGKNTRDIKLSSLRRSVLMTLQTNHVFNTTILKNITYGCKDLDKTKVLMALKKAGVDFIYKMPNGLETVIGSNGINLSGGEAQRIALARAFLFKPKVFIFDETTAFVDPETEEKIKHSLLELKENSTIIFIAHNLSTILLADNVAIMEHGVIKESGVPRVLINDETSYFFRLYSSVLKGGASPSIKGEASLSLHESLVA
ncbi:MAG: ABC transporter ATP-binding protein [Spirochaetota bacterium]